MWLRMGNLQTLVVNATDDERSWLSEYLSFEDASARYRHLGKSDGRVQMFNLFSGTFPTGFVPMVEKAARAEGLTCTRMDKRVAPCAADPAADLTWLRDYQREAVDALVLRTRGILWLPTGAGKTEIAVALTRVFPVRWLFVVHRAGLAGQAADRYELRSPGLRAGRVGEGRWDVHPDDALVCATFQTLARGLETNDQRVLDLLASAKGIVIDECHTLPAGSFLRVAMNAHNAHWRVGLSGTPLARGDRRSTLAIAATGPVIYRLRTERLVDAGVLAKPTIKMVEVTQRSEKPTWQGAYRECVVRSVPRNRAVVACAKAAEKPCLVFVKEIAHGRLVTKALEREGMRAEFVWGDAFADRRKRLVHDLESGRLDVLVCSVVLQEGVDIPALRSVVVASGGQSIIATLQRIGRGMRVERDAAGAVLKDTFEVWDVYDAGCGCKGKTHPGCRWLERHAQQRVRAYVSEGHTVTREQPVLSRNMTKAAVSE